jgi:cytochrome bd ubiquinol oxidase subunit I
MMAAFQTGGMLVLGVSAWKLLRGHDTRAFGRAARLAAAFTLASTLGVIITGDSQARLMTEQQPMKMAAAEALYNTTEGASFSLLTIGNLSGEPIFQIRIPHLLSLIATLSWNGKVEGIHQIQAAQEQRHGPGSYVPLIWVTYWGFRIMIGLDVLILVVSGWAYVLARRKRLERQRWFLWVAVVCIAAPFLANTAGWLFTEMGRQPWVVYGLMKTSAASSPTVGLGSVIATLAAFTIIYTVLGVVDLVLMRHFARRPRPKARRTRKGPSPSRPWCTDADRHPEHRRVLAHRGAVGGLLRARGL